MRWHVKGSQKYDNQSASVLSCGWQPLQLAPTRLQTSHQSPIHPAHGLRHPGVIALEVNVGADQERRLEDLRRACADLLTEAVPPPHAAAEERPLRTVAVRSHN